MFPSSVWYKESNIGQLSDQVLWVKQCQTSTPFTAERVLRVLHPSANTKSNSARRQGANRMQGHMRGWESADAAQRSDQPVWDRWIQIPWPFTYRTWPTVVWCFCQCRYTIVFSIHGVSENGSQKNFNIIQYIYIYIHTYIYIYLYYFIFMWSLKRLLANGCEVLLQEMWLDFLVPHFHQPILVYEQRTQSDLEKWSKATHERHSLVLQ